ncbi:C40 family peptidase [Tranquillimonas alkanivorans]|uniref:NlpC/P60 family protein n=1 Tax=Tranquillimonas alkanivorans TaxID=441119 RepID=A0A1I5L7H3_9RHOB|nr:NlpC/P60 family protein [Tranquillimonas alkanivorans]SFO93334.1 NlpC/P60 family protein [Tranquillimonas alkanivorans]
MSDRRETAANGRVAAAELKGAVEAERFVEGEVRQVAPPLATLWSAPDGRRERQLLHGEGFRVLEDRDGWSFGQAARDGFVGYMRSADLRDAVIPTHAVAVPATHVYPRPDMKTIEHMGLSFGSKIRIVGGADRFYETHDGGFVFRDHVRPVNRPLTDPATVAQLFFGVPYLWGGNSVWGIDCSGLVQAACLACGIECPGDSDQQEARLGHPVDMDAPVQRGDLFFWSGHVAMAVDAETLIHANAFRMAVAYEPLCEAIARIEAQGDGPVTARRRV